MPRLKRVHFASIGHRDARLAPLTLELCDEQGDAMDSVVWLRNGGGKSSILNLLFSTLRPNLNEFLGKSVDGQSRQLSDYVGASDTAFVIAEWAFDPEQLGLGFEVPPSRIVGQVLEWQGRQRSVDSSRLQRRFFSFRTDAAVDWQALPVAGISDAPVGSLQAFVDWLEGVRRDGPAREVTIEERQAAWSRHLESLHLDPELFGYQLRMNRREGAADELFRFASSRAFIDFFLELTLDTSRANMVSATLTEFRTKLEKLPARKLEHAFAIEALTALHPLLLGNAKRAEARSAQDTVESRARSIAAGLVGRMEVIKAQRLALDEARDTQEERKQRLDNELSRVQRWLGGLERLAIQFDAEEAREAHRQAVEARDEAARRAALLDACAPFRRVRELENRVAQLKQQLATEQRAQAPVLEKLQRAGAALRSALDDAMRDAEAHATRFDARAQAAEAEADEAAELRERAATTIGVAAERIESLEREMRNRQQGRQVLLDDNLVDNNEPATEARERWRQLGARAGERGSDAESDRDAARADLDRTTAELAQVGEKRVACETQLGQAQQQLATVREERDQIETTTVLAELEELDRADVFAHGLSARARSRAAALERKRLQQAVEGAEDERAARSVQERGLLPGSVDAERVARELVEAGIAAHLSTEYIAENVRTDLAAKQRLLATDPARFSGVMVPAAAFDRAAAHLRASALVVRGPVTVSADAIDAPTDGAGEPGHARLVVQVGMEGAYDYTAATAEADRIEQRQRGRSGASARLAAEAQELHRSADTVDRFVGAWGNGQLEHLIERVGRLQAETERLCEQQRALNDASTALQQRISEATERATVAFGEQARAATCGERIDRFVERFEQHVEAWKLSLHEAREQRQTAERERELANRKRAGAQQVRDAERERLHEARRNAKAYAAERDAVAHADDAPADPPPLDEARRAYESRRIEYERVVGDSELRGVLRATRSELEHATGELSAKLSGGALNREEVERMESLAGPRLRELQQEAAHEALQRGVEVLRTDEVRSEAERKAEALPVRVRQSDDVPTGEPPLQTAAACRARAETLGLEGERLRDDASALERERAFTKESVAEANRAHEQVAASRKRLDDLEIRPGVACELPEALDELSAWVDDAVRDTHQARHATVAAQGAVVAAVERVRSVARDVRWAAHQSAWKQRLLDASEELAADAKRWHEGLSERAAVLEDEIANIERDRASVVNELLVVAEEGLALLERVTKSSRLPDSLGRWAGQPFLRIALDIPAADDERRSRLTPLVDELVESGNVPGGLALVQRAISRLHGARSMNVTILKPEAARRLDRIDVEAMANFSGGERLTAAVMLYCTLVRLRSFARGRRDRVPGNVLVLDNPIGTCSSVALIELQREVATAMGTQLVYTTGVDDLAALAQLPNVVRLRNVHRDVATGNLHVTVEGEQVDDQHVVQATRIARRAGLPATGEPAR